MFGEPILSVSQSHPPTPVNSPGPPPADNTSTAAALAVGAGVGFPLGGVNGFLAAGYTSDLGGDIDMTYFGLYAGLSFALGGG